MFSLSERKGPWSLPSLDITPLVSIFGLYVKHGVFFLATPVHDIETSTTRIKELVCRVTEEMLDNP